MKNSNDQSPQQEPQPFVPERLEKTKNSQGVGGHILLLLMFILVMTVATGLVFMKTVSFSLVPADGQAKHAGGMSVLSSNKLYGFAGEHTVQFSASGYADKTVLVTLDGDMPASMAVELDALPGKIDFHLSGPKTDSLDSPAQLYIDDKLVGDLAGQVLELPQGIYSYRVEHNRYFPAEGQIKVLGFGKEQTETIAMSPNWRHITLLSKPLGATVYDEDNELGTTPLKVDLKPGLYVLKYSKLGFADTKQLLEFELGPDMEAETVIMAPAEGVFEVSSKPKGARIFINNEYMGLTPMSLVGEEGQNYQITIEKDGYRRWSSFQKVSPGKTVDINVDLVQQFGTVVIDSQPQASIYIDGANHGQAPIHMELPIGEHEIVFYLPEYRILKRVVSVEEGQTHKVSASLQFEKDARIAGAKPAYPNSLGINMVLAKPGQFAMGAPRGESGQRANEIQKTVNLKRWFYIADAEVTMGQFLEFMDDIQGKVTEVPPAATHKDLPAWGMRWLDAVLFANWLSLRENLPVAYKVDGKGITLDETSIGYRLPTEAEWEWAARMEGRKVGSPLKFPWGSSQTVPKGAGNFADKSAVGVTHKIPSYSDGYPKLAPVKSFTPNALGLYDMGGNVSEWVHDYYGIMPVPAGQVLVDPTGPQVGIDHVVKGSSWKSGTETELRYSYRDYSDGAADHIGFRLARWVH